jgi:hypothetical protein
MGDKDSPPKQINGKCEGYQKNLIDDEPCEICKECKLNMMYEDELKESEE